MSKKDKTSGRNANQYEKYVEGCVHDFLDKVCGYEYIPPNKFLVTSNSLNQKIFTRQLAICDSIDSIKADFVLYNPKLEEKYFIIEVTVQYCYSSLYFSTITCHRKLRP